MELRFRRRCLLSPERHKPFPVSALHLEPPELPPALRPAPWVRLARVLPPDSADLFLRLDSLSPTGSAYDRRCWLLVEQAIRLGRLRPGQRVIEGSDGATAVSMAWVCATRGHPFTAVLPESATPETQALLAAYGAQLVLTPFGEGLPGALKRARAELEHLGPSSAWSPQLHGSPDGAKVEKMLLGRELLDAVAGQGRIDGFVCGVGTGATLAATARMKSDGELPKALKLVAVEPQESAALLASKPVHRPHWVFGLGPGFVPEPLGPAELEAVDRVSRIDAATAWAMTQRLAREEGLLVGISTGAVVEAAVRLAQEVGRERAIFTLAQDTGERYFSLSEQLSP